ncbi:MAG: conserved phage C-terminal domain-containing protein [Ruminococcus sp.]|nr:conserved phage C-terminal domain-containing protein [Ruminococcus sp.]
MKASKIGDDNYFQISGWMINRLGLKGTLLKIFAIIYGFSQDGESRFAGSLQYLMDFTGASRRTVIYSLKELTEKGYLIKHETEKNGIKFNEYEIAPGVQKLHGVSAEIAPEGVQKLHRGGAKIAPNNIEDNIDLDNKINNIISYLNEKAQTSYRASGKETQRLLKNLLTGKNPYTVDDCKKVIDNMVQAWAGTEFEQYLRPSTLFGNKFENYLNWKVKRQPKHETEAERLRREQDEQMLALLEGDS